MASADGSSTSADPLRPSSKAFALRSPISIDGLPPTPVTAGLKLSPIDGSKPDSQSSSSHGGVQQRMRLPGLSVMLNVDSPPPSAQPELYSSEQEVLADGEMQAPPALRPSATGVFSGQPAEWTTGSGSMAPPAAPRLRAGALPMIRRGTWHPSSSSGSNSWRSMPSDEKVEGLGLQLHGGDSPMAAEMSGLALVGGDMTPRLPSLSSPLATPTLHSWGAPVMPGAPRLSSGRFESTVPSSPISPALDARWQAPLRFDSTPFAAESAAPMSSWTPRAVRAAEMERERTVCIEGGMPRMEGVRGLGIDFEYAPSNAAAGPSRLGRGVVAQPPLRDVMQEDAPAAIRRTPALVRTLSSSSPGVGPTRSSGLTPHVEKTRLTPYSSASRSKNNASPPSAATAAGATAGAESPSLRTQSKARSDLLRERAMAAAASLPADGSAAHVSSPTASKNKGASSGRPGSAPTSASAATASPPKRRGLSERKATSNRDGDMSPWGVFDLGSTDDGAWTPLGPPTACGGAVKGEVSSAKAPAARASHEPRGKENVGPSGKQRRAAGSSEPGSKAQGNTAKQGSARSARKDVFGSTSPTETTAAAARRFVSMR
jgi:hypothetical protein